MPANKNDRKSFQTKLYTDKYATLSLRYNEFKQFGFYLNGTIRTFRQYL